MTSTTGTGKGGAITVGDVRQALAQGRERRVLLRDGSEGGLYLRAGARGAVWWVEFKPPGRRTDGSRHPTRHLKLGSVQVLGPDAARQKAAKAKHAVMEGHDPIEARRAAQARAAAPSWADVRADYERHLERKLTNPRSRQNERAYLAHLFAPGRLDASVPLRLIDLPAVHRLMDALPAVGTVARQVVGALGRLLDWCIGRGITDTANPVRLLPRGARPTKALPRTRALSVDEIGLLWRGADALDPVERRLLRLLVAIPLRRSEVAALRWEWIDAQAGMVMLPGKVMKNGQAHTIPLGDAARRVLNDIADGEWPGAGRVFVTNNARTLEWSRFKARIDKAAPLKAPWTFHDLRRSFVSALAERGHDEAVLDAMLAHRASATRSGVLGVYQTARRLPEQRAAMAEWDALLQGAACESNVVRMRA